MPDKDEIEQIERAFWQALVDKDTEVAAGMIADRCLIAGPSGSMRIDPEKYIAMMRDGKWTLEKFEFSNVDVIFPTEDTAVIAYRVRQQGVMKDGPMDLNCADASIWVKSDQGWKCALHTETILKPA